MPAQSPPGRRMSATAQFRGKFFAGQGNRSPCAALRDDHGENAWGRTGMGRCQEYRRYARECLEMANVTEDPQLRATLLQMAQTWFRLADERAQAPARDTGR